jgi:hypothetical protein
LLLLLLLLRLMLLQSKLLGHNRLGLWMLSLIC